MGLSRGGAASGVPDTPDIDRGTPEEAPDTGTPEEVLTCVENILNSIGQGDCLACICVVIPALCQGNNIIVTEDEVETRPEVDDKDEEGRGRKGASCEIGGG